MSLPLLSKLNFCFRNSNYRRFFQIGHISNIVQLRKQRASFTIFNDFKSRSKVGTSLKGSRPKSTVLDLFSWVSGISVTTHSGKKSQPKFCRSLKMSSARKDEDCLDANRLIWIDLEMTGLNVEKERIIEIACLITEGDLRIVAKGPNLVIHQNDKLLENMDEWCTLHHGQSGLTEAVRNSKISTEEAEARVLRFVKQYVPCGKCPLAGNSVSTDKLFLERYMPRLVEHLHYRIVDVSTVKELCRRWYPEDFKNAPAKKLTHRAMDDIVESVEELKYYRATLFKS